MASKPLPGAPQVNSAALYSRVMIYCNTSTKISACCPGIADGHNPTFGCRLIFAIHGPWSAVLDQGPALALSGYINPNWSVWNLLGQHWSLKLVWLSGTH
jgi:hypothetical protein